MASVTRAGKRTTWQMGVDPCPFCGETDWHSIEFISGEVPRCGLTEAGQRAEDERRAKWMTDWHEAVRLDSVIAAVEQYGGVDGLRARAAELRASMLSQAKS